MTSTKKDEVDKTSFHNPYSPMSPEQCRAARAWLKWSQADLAERASIGLSTVKDFENDKREPISNNLAAIQSAFERAGIYPVSDDQNAPIGIELRKRAGD